MTFAACMVAMTLGEVLFVPSSVGLASRMGPPKEHGRYVGSFGLIRTIGWAGAPWVGGGLLDRFPGRPLAVWAPIAALALIASGLYLISSGGFARKMGISDIANGDLSLTALTNKNRAEKPPLSHPPD
jgi:MFS family permease